MKCRNCGQELSSYMRFCINCGCPIEKTDSHLSNPVSTKEEENYASHQQVQSETERKKKKKNSWLWIIVTLIIGSGIGWYFYTNSSQEQSLSENHVDSENHDDDKATNESNEINLENEEIQAFIKDFYLHYLDESYLRDNVTEHVLKQLRRDYPYECEESDCLATWVFSAYPAGTDMELEEGPIISGGGTPFIVSYKYSYLYNGQKCYEDRSVKVWVNNDEGRYKVFAYNYYDKTQAPRYDEEKRINEIPEGNYHLTSADMHVLLNVHDSIVEGEYYFHAGSSLSTSVKLYGKADNGIKLHLRQWNAVNKKNLGFMDGTFDGKTFKGEYDKEGYRSQFEVYYNE